MFFWLEKSLIFLEGVRLEVFYGVVVFEFKTMVVREKGSWE